MENMSVKPYVAGLAQQAGANQSLKDGANRVAGSSGMAPLAAQPFSSALAQSLSKPAASGTSAASVPSASAVQADALWAEWISSETQAMLASSLGGSSSGGLFGGSSSGLSGLLGSLSGSSSGLSGLLGSLGGSSSGMDLADLTGLLPPLGSTNSESTGLNANAQALAEILSGYLSGSQGGLGVPFGAVPDPLTSAAQVPQTVSPSQVRAQQSSPAGPEMTAGYNAAQAPSGLLAWIDRLAPAFGLSPQLVQSVIAQESGFSPNATSPAGAMGLMQLMPGTAAMLGVRNPYNPLENLVGGMQYLGGLMKRYHGNVSMALAAYNAGPGAVDRYGGVPPYPETEQYVSDILSRLGGAAP